MTKIGTVNTTGLRLPLIRTISLCAWKWG